MHGSPGGSLELKTWAGLRLTLRGGSKRSRADPLGRDGGLLREERFALPSCSVFWQTPLWRQKYDCKLQSISRYSSNAVATTNYADI